MLQTILMGGVDTRERRFKRKLAWHSKCFFCCFFSPSPVETVPHVLHECAGHDRDDLLAKVATEPRCAQMCGIFTEDPRILELENALSAMVEEPHDSPVGQPSDTIFQGRVVVYTDGACKHPRMARIRRAGSGAFYGVDSPSNFSRALPGGRQTNQRAELWAALLVMESDARALEIRTDSKYVHDGVRRWPQWRHLGWGGGNADLWQRVHQCLERAPGRVMTTKVKGHATWQDVESRRVLLEDKIGNAHADRLAGAGADMHRAMVELERAANDRREVARHAQGIMVSILVDRAEKLDMLPSRVVEPPPTQGFTRRVARRLNPP